MKTCHFLPLCNGLTCNNKWGKMNGDYKRIYDCNNYTSPMKNIGCYPTKEDSIQSSTLFQQKYLWMMEMMMDVRLVLNHM